MAENNRLWGAEKIRGELLKLGISVSKRTIQKHMEKVRKQPNQNWTTHQMVINFLVLYDQDKQWSQF
jgi:hypothetical protein